MAEPIVVVFKAEAEGWEVSFECVGLTPRERATAIAGARERFFLTFGDTPESFGLRLVVERWERDPARAGSPEKL